MYSALAETVQKVTNACNKTWLQLPTRRMASAQGGPTSGEHNQMNGPDSCGALTCTIQANGRGFVTSAKFARLLQYTLLERMLRQAHKRPAHTPRRMQDAGLQSGHCRNNVRESGDGGPLEQVRHVARKNMAREGLEEAGWGTEVTSSELWSTRASR